MNDPYNVIFFLDFGIFVRNNNLITSFYDKVNTFPSSVVWLPYFQHNIRHKFFNTSTGSRIPSWSRTTTSQNKFVEILSNKPAKKKKQTWEKMFKIKALSKINYGRLSSIFWILENTSAAFWHIFHLQTIGSLRSFE